MKKNPTTLSFTKHAAYEKLKDKFLILGFWLFWMVFVTFGVSDVLVYVFMFYLCCLKLGHIQEIPKQV